MAIEKNELCFLDEGESQFLLPGDLLFKVNDENFSGNKVTFLLHRLIKIGQGLGLIKSKIVGEENHGFDEIDIVHAAIVTSLGIENEEDAEDPCLKKSKVATICEMSQPGATSTVIKREATLFPGLGINVEANARISFKSEGHRWILYRMPTILDPILTKLDVFTSFSKQETLINIAEKIVSKVNAFYVDKITETEVDIAKSEIKELWQFIDNDMEGYSLLKKINTWNDTEISINTIKAAAILVLRNWAKDIANSLTHIKSNLKDNKNSTKYKESEQDKIQRAKENQKNAIPLGPHETPSRLPKYATTAAACSAFNSISGVTSQQKEYLKQHWILDKITEFEEAGIIVPKEHFCSNFVNFVYCLADQLMNPDLQKPNSVTKHVINQNYQCSPATLISFLNKSDNWKRIQFRPATGNTLTWNKVQFNKGFERNKIDDTSQVIMNSRFYDIEYYFILKPREDNSPKIKNCLSFSDLGITREIALKSLIDNIADPQVQQHISVDVQNKKMECQQKPDSLQFTHSDIDSMSPKKNKEVDEHFSFAGPKYLQDVPHHSNINETQNNVSQVVSKEAMFKSHLETLNSDNLSINFALAWAKANRRTFRTWKLSGSDSFTLSLAEDLSVLNFPNDSNPPIDVFNTDDFYIKLIKTQKPLSISKQKGIVIHPPKIQEKSNSLTIHTLGPGLEKGNSFTKNTAGGGNCAFHAIFGEWDGSWFVCEHHDLLSRRKKVADEIRNCNENSPIFTSVVEAVQQLLMEDDVGEVIADLRNEYNLYRDKNKNQTNEAWLKLQVELLKNLDISELIIKNTKDNKKLVNFKQKFQFCLKLESGVLKKLINSREPLCQLFEVFNKITKDDFDLKKRIAEDKEILNEYANYIQRLGQTLLPVELKIIALIYDINIKFCTFNPHTGLYTQPVDLNQHGNRNVGVCFNGANHFERADEQQMLNNVIAPQNPANLSTLSKNLSALNVNSQVEIQKVSNAEVKPLQFSKMVVTKEPSNIKPVLAKTSSANLQTVENPQGLQNSENTFRSSPRRGGSLGAKLGKFLRFYRMI